MQYLLEILKGFNLQNVNKNSFLTCNNAALEIIHNNLRYRECEVTIRKFTGFSDLCQETSLYGTIQ